MTENGKRPGVMLYFDTFCPALGLDDAQLAALTRGIISYAMTGALPELEAMAEMAFLMLRPGIDRDGERYERVRLHGQYMAYCRKCKEHGETPVSEEEYLERLAATNSCSHEQAGANCNCTLPTRYSSPYPHPSSTVDSSIDSSPSPNAHAGGRVKVEGYGGTEREGTSIADYDEITKRQRNLAFQIEEYRQRNGDFPDGF